LGIRIPRILPAVKTNIKREI